jgi:endoribonuclease Nob1
LVSQDSHSRYAVDSGAFYTGVVFLSSSSSSSSSSASRSRYCTTQSILDEVKHIKKSHGAIEALIESNILEIINPETQSIERVTTAAKRTGDYTRLSEADISIIALALQQMGIVLITNDNTVANLASTLRIPVKSASGKGITERRRWITYCSACGKAFGPNATECRLCGNKLRRKYKVV